LIHDQGSVSRPGTVATTAAIVGARLGRRVQVNRKNVGRRGVARQTTGLIAVLATTTRDAFHLARVADRTLLVSLAGQFGDIRVGLGETSGREEQKRWHELEPQPSIRASLGLHQ
jgi:hypothetical protein